MTSVPPQRSPTLSGIWASTPVCVLLWDLKLTTDGLRASSRRSLSAHSFLALPALFQENDGLFFPEMSHLSTFDKWKEE